MAKSYFRYTEILCDENLMDCVYLMNGYCTAQPTSLSGVNYKIAGYYKPTEEDCKNFCNNSAKFKDCPRFVAYLNYLAARGLTK